MSTIFRGSGVALVTPMKENEEINYDVMDALIEDQIAKGTDALIVCGTSGEAPTLDDPEHLEAIRFAVERTKGRVPVIAGGPCACNPEPLAPFIDAFQIFCSGWPSRVLLPKCLPAAS